MLLSKSVKTTTTPHKKIPVRRAAAYSTAQQKSLSCRSTEADPNQSFRTDFPSTPAAQLQIQIEQSPRLVSQRKRLNRLFGAGRPATQHKKPTKPMQRLEDEDLDKKGLREKKKLAKKYSNSLGFMTPLYDYAEEDFDYYFEKATSLNNLETLIDNAIEKAKAKKQAAESKTSKEEEQPEVESLPSTSTTTALPSSEKVAPKKKTKKKKKARRKDITAEVLSGSSSYKQETVYATPDVTNTLLQSWIGGKPGGATCDFGGFYVSEDTVYIYATVEIPDPTVTAFPQVNRYQIETHYHPVPISSNFLHVKGRSGGSSQNVLGSGNWLIPGGTATLRQAVQQWDSAKPENKSPHSW